MNGQETEPALHSCGDPLLSERNVNPERMPQRSMSCEPYLKELAELMLSKPECWEGVDSCALDGLLKHIKTRDKGSGAVQEDNVSSSQTATILPSHVAPMLLEALDGFFFLINSEGNVDFISANVSRYLNCDQAQMVGKSILEFIKPSQRDLFASLLADNPELQLEWMNRGKERQSHSFMCDFRITTPFQKNDELEEGTSSPFSAPCSGPEGSNSEYLSLQVSVITLPYPSDSGDDYVPFSSSTSACLVCVARRQGTQQGSVGSCGSITPSLDMGTHPCDTTQRHCYINEKFIMTVTKDLIIANTESSKSSEVYKLLAKESLIGLSLNDILRPGDVAVLRHTVKTILEASTHNDIVTPLSFEAKVRFSDLQLLIKFTPLRHRDSEEFDVKFDCAIVGKLDDSASTTISNSTVGAETGSTYFSSTQPLPVTPQSSFGNLAPLRDEYSSNDMAHVSLNEGNNLFGNLLDHAIPTSEAFLPDGLVDPEYDLSIECLQATAVPQGDFAASLNESGTGSEFDSFLEEFLSPGRTGTGSVCSMVTAEHRPSSGGPGSVISVDFSTKSEPTGRVGTDDKSPATAFSAVNFSPGYNGQTTGGRFMDQPTRLSFSESGFEDSAGGMEKPLRQYSTQAAPADSSTQSPEQTGGFDPQFIQSSSQLQDGSPDKLQEICSMVFSSEELHQSPFQNESNTGRVSVPTASPHLTQHPYYSQAPLPSKQHTMLKDLLNNNKDGGPPVNTARKPSLSSTSTALPYSIPGPSNTGKQGGAKSGAPARTRKPRKNSKQQQQQQPISGNQQGSGAFPTQIPGGTYQHLLQGLGESTDGLPSPMPSRHHGGFDPRRAESIVNEIVESTVADRGINSSFAQQRDFHHPSYIRGLPQGRNGLDPLHYPAMRESGRERGISTTSSTNSQQGPMSETAQKNCILVKLLSQSPQVPPVVPSSMAVPQFDRVSKNPKDDSSNPHTVATGLVESLLNRSRTVSQVGPPPMLPDSSTGSPQEPTSSQMSPYAAYNGPASQQIDFPGCSGPRGRNLVHSPLPPPPTSQHLSPEQCKTLQRMAHFPNQSAYSPQIPDMPSPAGPIHRSHSETSALSPLMAREGQGQIITIKHPFGSEFQNSNSGLMGSGRQISQESSLRAAMSRPTRLPVNFNGGMMGLPSFAAQTFNSRPRRFNPSSAPVTPSDWSPPPVPIRPGSNFSTEHFQMPHHGGGSQLGEGRSNSRGLVAPQGSFNAGECNLPQSPVSMMHQQKSFQARNVTGEPQGWHGSSTPTPTPTSPHPAFRNEAMSPNSATHSALFYSRKLQAQQHQLNLQQQRQGVLGSDGNSLIYEVSERSSQQQFYQNQNQFFQ